MDFDDNSSWTDSDSGWSSGTDVDSDLMTGGGVGGGAGGEGSAYVPTWATARGGGGASRSGRSRRGSSSSVSTTFSTTPSLFSAGGGGLRLRRDNGWGGGGGGSGRSGGGRTLRFASASSSETRGKIKDEMATALCPVVFSRLVVFCFSALTVPCTHARTQARFDSTSVSIYGVPCAGEALVGLSRGIQLLSAAPFFCPCIHSPQIIVHVFVFFRVSGTNTTSVCCCCFFLFFTIFGYGHARLSNFCFF